MNLEGDGHTCTWEGTGRKVIMGNRRLLTTDTLTETAWEGCILFSTCPAKDQHQSLQLHHTLAHSRLSCLFSTKTARWRSSTLKHLVPCHEMKSCQGREQCCLLNPSLLPPSFSPLSPVLFLSPFSLSLSLSSCHLRCRTVPGLEA